MGFSTSGATVIVFIGLLVAFTALYGSVNNSGEKVSKAVEERNERMLERANADINITNVSFDPSLTPVGSDVLNVTINNTGSRALSANETTLVVDGEFVEPDQRRVEGERGRDVWAPGEQLKLTVTNTADPSRVKVVTELGIADTETGV